MELLAWLAAAIGVAHPRRSSSGPLRRRGAGALNLDLLTKTPAAVQPDAGRRRVSRTRSPASLVIVGIATRDGAARRDPRRPLPRTSSPAQASRSVVSLALDVLNGVPAIVIGIFVYGLLVVGHGQSALRRRVRARLPDAAARRALDDGGARARADARCARRRSRSACRAGARRSASCCRRRSAASSRARCSPSRASPARRRRCSSPPRSSARSVSWNPHHALQTVPVAIFELAESPDPADHARAWAAAFVLLVFILVASLGARWLATRSTPPDEHASLMRRRQPCRLRSSAP